MANDQSSSAFFPVADDPVERHKQGLALHADNRTRFCGFDGPIKPDDPELKAAARRLFDLALGYSGASPRAARILYGCYSGQTAFTVGDFRGLDPFNFRAAMIVLNFALFEGCERILTDAEMAYLKERFDLEAL